MTFQKHGRRFNFKILIVKYIFSSGQEDDKRVELLTYAVCLRLLREQEKDAVTHFASRRSWLELDPEKLRLRPERFRLDPPLVVTLIVDLHQQEFVSREANLAGFLPDTNFGKI